MCQRIYIYRVECKTHLAVEIKNVEGENADLDRYVLCLDILSLSRHELLERQDLLFDHIPGYCLAVKHEAFRSFFDPSRQLRKDIRVLL